jgi:hypothetical protein
MPEGEDPLLVPLTASTQEDERTVLDRILASGVDQGCFVRPSPDQLAAVDHERLERLLDDVSTRPASCPSIDDPYTDHDPPSAGIDGDEPGWVVLTQRCDLIRAYQVEPLVELARVTPVTDERILQQARSNSPRYIALAERPGGAWVIDLRRRGWLPKHLLPDLEVVQPVPDARALKRLRLRLGQRYWRDPVPDDIVRDVQHPLRDALRGSRARVTRASYFSEWLGLRDDDKVLVLPVLGQGKNRREAEAAFDEVVADLAPDVRERLAPESSVVSVDDISFGLWLDAFKFDFDEISYGRRADADHATPDL